MYEQYQLFINSFTEHLKQLTMCDEKVVSISKTNEELAKKYEQSLEKIENELNIFFDAFKSSIDKVTLEQIEQASVRATLLREQNNFFVTNYDVLASGECDVKKTLRANISKLNLLLEAALKLKFFILDRKEKLLAKYPEEDHKKLFEISAASAALADRINLTVSKQNAHLAFTFAKELEINSRLQTLETIISELKKRYISLS